MRTLLLLFEVAEPFITNGCEKDIKSSVTIDAYCINTTIKGPMSTHILQS